MKAAILTALVAVCLLAGVAVAAIGDLIQQPGTAGCISGTGTNGDCVDGTALDGAFSVTVSPDGKSAYVASIFSAAVTVFDRATDGKLTQKPGTAGCISEDGTGDDCVEGTALGFAASVTVSPDGDNAYVASATSAAVAVFDRVADGTLTQKPLTEACISEDGTGGDCVEGNALSNARSVTVSPDGDNAYVASATSDAVAVFDREADGTLTQKLLTEACISESGTSGECVDGKALDEATSVTVSPDGDNAYVASRSSESVAVFDRDADGVLTQKPEPAGCISETGRSIPSMPSTADECLDGKALDEPFSVTVSPDGNSAYVASGQNSDAVAVFDRAADGTLTQKPGTAGCISETGSGGDCADGTVIESARSVTVSPDGNDVYVGGFSAVAVFARAANGTLTQKPGTAGCISDSGSGDACFDATALEGPIGITASPDDNNVYATSFDSDAVTVFEHEGVPPPPGPPSPPPPPLVSDTTRPLVSALSLSATRFSAAGSGPAIAAGVGTTVSYGLSEPATTRFKVERALPGRRVSGRCVAPKRSNRGAKRCTRHRTLRGGFTHQGDTGSNRFTFRGRLRARKLRPGRYRLRAVATDPAGNPSRPKRSRFRIVAR